ncbi:OVA1 [Scenedesmus sp. PABB004]|nr:OVA1 [Scenedesmus sp. PABB004]
MFWYRNAIYAIEARSPAEGAYSEGFIKAKFTQDYCIECPATGSLFSLKDGSIAAWYPGNPVLRALTPQDTCRPLDIYPVKLTQEALYVDVSNKRVRAYSDRGGAGTSLENNNVFTVQPTVYFEGMDPATESASMYTDVDSMPPGALNPATVTVGIVALGIVAVAGSATAIYYESVIGLAAFWVVLGGLVGVAGMQARALGRCGASCALAGRRPGWGMRPRPSPRPRAACSASGEAETFTLTTPLYYVNAKPHMGSAYPTIAADVLARYQRLAGRRVRFLTGTDEHGEKIALAAEARGMSPQQHCDDIVQQYQALWAALDVAYDGFVRTTDPGHEALVREVLTRVWERGDIYKAAYAGWYCVDCEEYKDEKELDAEHTCPTHRKPCQHREEENYFFALSKYQAQLEELLARDGDDAFVSPPARRNEVLGWVREGVRDFSISRAAAASPWGIRLPQDADHTVYVWFDALNGYLSGLVPLADGDGASASGGGGGGAVGAALSRGWPADVHVIGKDILRFHAIYWPGMLLSAGLPLPRRVFGHGFLTKDGLKMGKALGNTLDPEALVAGYGADAVRLFFMKEVAFGQDGNFSEAAFRDTVNASLANAVGNMLNRTLGLLTKNCGGALPAGAAEAAPAGAGHALRDAVEAAVPAAAAAYARLSPHAAVEACLGIAAAGNLYLEQTAPWSALKKGDDAERAAAGRVLVAVLEAARILAVALSPVTPGLSARMYGQLGLGGAPLQGRVSWADTAWGQLAAGHATAEPAPVFARIDEAVPYVTEPAPAAAAAATADAGGKAKGKASPPGQGKKAKARAEKAARAAAAAAAAGEAPAGAPAAEAKEAAAAPAS